MLKDLKLVYGQNRPISEQWAQKINLEIWPRNLYAEKQNPTREDIEYVLNQMDYKLGSKFRLDWIDEKSGHAHKFFVGSTEYDRVFNDDLGYGVTDLDALKAVQAEDGSIREEKVVMCELYDSTRDKLPYYYTVTKEFMLEVIMDLIENGLPPEVAKLFPSSNIPPATT